MREIVATKNFVVMELKIILKSRIALPENASPIDGVSMMEVIRVGPKCRYIKVGDAIVVDPQAVIKFKHGDTDYFVTNEDNVGAVLREL